MKDNLLRSLLTLIFTFRDDRSQPFSVRVTLVRFAVLICALSGLGSPLLAQTQPRLQDATFKIGLIYPKTGPLAPYAQSLANAVRLGLEEFRQDHGDLGSEIAVVVADDQSLASTAEQAAERLIQTQKVNILIGSFSNIVNQALIPVARKHNIPLLLPRPADASMTEQPLVFAMSPTHRWLGRMLGFYAAQSLNKRRAAIVSEPGDAISAELVEGFKEAFAKGGGFIVGNWESTQKDSLRDLQMTEPDMVLIPAAFAKDQDDLITQVLRGSWDVMSTRRMFRKPLTAPIYLGETFSAADPHQGVRDFTALYQKKYQKVPDELAASAYESIRVILQSYFLSKTVRNAPLLDTLQKRELGGIYGLGRFTENRMFVRPIPIVRSVMGKEEFKGRIQPE